MSEQKRLEFLELYEVEQNPELKQAYEKNKQLDEDLGLGIPPEVTDQEANLWDALNRMLREMYAKGYITQSDIDSIYEAFYDQDLDGKQEGLRKVHLLLTRQNEQVELLEELRSQEEAVDAVVEVLERLPQEVQRIIIDYMQRDEDLPQDIQALLPQDINTDEIAYDKLSKVLNKEFQLDVSDLEATGKVMSPKDLLKRFKVSIDAIQPESSTSKNSVKADRDN